MGGRDLGQPGQPGQPGSHEQALALPWRRTLTNRSDVKYVFPRYHLQGPLCASRCPVGTYGYRCSKNCTNCHNGASCDPVNGTCACAPGYRGPTWVPTHPSLPNLGVRSNEDESSCTLSPHQLSDTASTLCIQEDTTRSNETSLHYIQAWNSPGSVAALGSLFSARFPMCSSSRRPLFW